MYGITKSFEGDMEKRDLGRTITTASEFLAVETSKEYIGKILVLY